MVLQGKVLAGPYTLLAPLGRGGMGQVWEARDERLDRTVAVKLLNAPETDSDSTRRFTRETTVTAGLSHPGVRAGDLLEYWNTRTGRKRPAYGWPLSLSPDAGRVRR